MIIKTTELRTALNSTKKFVWTDKHTKREPLDCVRFDVSDKLYIVSTDGYKLNKVTIDSVPSNMDSFNVSTNIVFTILEDIKGVKGNVELSLDKDILTLTTDNNIYTYNVILGVYPDYNKVINDLKDLSNTLTIDRKYLLNILKENKNNVNKRTQLSIFEYYAQDCKFTFADRENSIENIVSIDSDNYIGIELKIGFNLKYLSLILSKLKSKEITIHFGNSVNQIQVVGNDSKDKGYRFLIMPLRIQ